MKFNTFICGSLTTIALMSVAAIIFNKCGGSEQILPDRTTTQVVYDTIPKYIDTPVLVDSTVIKYIKIKVPVSDKIASTDTTHINEDLTVELPITQKVYQDSTYKAWVSGYHPALDSIMIYHPITTITKTITKTDVVYKSKKWGVGVQVGVGVTSNKIEPYIGIGVTYNIFSW